MPSATAKRSRRIAFEADDQEGAVTAEASSRLRNDMQRKKARVSAAHMRRPFARSQHQHSAGSSSDEDEVTQERSPAPERPAASQFEQDRDMNFEHLQHIEEDDQRATQRLRNRPELIGDNHAALNAVLESIEVINFMCHERLKVDLGPLLNFIVGENGSGKSAVLTAITLCLGGKASSTNRGASLKSFIRQGQDHGQLIVKIKNQGPDAYKPELYGDSVIVERHFNKSGSSGFKLKSAAGRIISTKRDDVQDVVDYYCLQVDNPLNVLSQDNARQFLNSATPAQKYSYFLQGTQLQQLSDDLQLIHEHIDATEAKLHGFEDNFNAIKAQMEKYAKLKESAGKNEELKNKSKVYQKQLAWAQVAEEEVILQEKENKVAAIQEQLQALEGQIEERASLLEQQDGLINSAQADVEQMRQEESELQQKKEDAKEAFDQAKAAVQKMHTQERDVHGQLKSANDHVRKLQGKIEAEERRLEEANGGAMTEKQRALDIARAAVDSANEAIAAHTERGQELGDEFRRAETALQEGSGPVDDKRRQIHEVEKRVRLLSQKSQDPLAAYVDKMPQLPQLLKLIEGDHSFRQRPIGPVGMHVQLIKPQWSTILETLLNGTLDGFIVSCKEDQLKLARHMERCRWKQNKQPQIFISRPGLRLDNLKEPDEELDTILRVLKIDNAQVRNQLIISNNVEQCALVPSMEEAGRIMLQGQPPRNVAVCITHNPHSNKKGHGLSYQASRNGNTTTTPVRCYDGRPRMKSNSDEELSFQKESLAQLHSELRELESAKRVLQQAAQKASQAVTQHKGQAAALKRAVREAEANVSTAEAALDAYDGTDMRLQGLREELEHAKANKDQYGQQYGELAVEKQELNTAVSVAKGVLEEARERRSNFDDRMRKATLKVSRLESLRQITVQEKNAAHQAYEEMKVGKERAEVSRERQQTHVEDFVRQASEFCPERVFIPEGDTYASIAQKYEAIRKRLAEFKDRHGMDERQINDKAAETYEEYDKARRFRQDCELDVKASKHALLKRFSKWRNFQRMISAAARTNFAYLLSERAFRGRLLLDHQNKRLGIEVEPDQTRENVSGRNTKTLSGGEKSFSSICLLLAIWDAMGSPLRCLDEFDVFMDVVNRGISTKMLVQAARRSVGKQFILITPNAIEGNVQYDKDVTIIRLSDPRQRHMTDYTT